MVQIAKDLSEPFPFTRIDLYNIDGKVYFGEITFYDASGCIKFHPESLDKQVAEWINH